MFWWIQTAVFYTYTSQDYILPNIISCLLILLSDYFSPIATVIQDHLMKVFKKMHKSHASRNGQFRIKKNKHKFSIMVFKVLCFIHSPRICIIQLVKIRFLKNLILATENLERGELKLQMVQNRVVDTLDDCAAHQNNFDRLEKWANRNLKFNNTKCTLLNLGRKIPIHPHTLGDHQLEKKVSGVLADNKLNM